MNKKTKIIIAVVLGVFLLCIFACVGGWFGLKTLEKSMIINDPQQAKAIAKNTIDYELPSGYQEETALNLGIMKMVMASDVASTEIATDRPLISIVSIPPNTDITEEQFQSQIQQSAINQGMSMILVEEQKVTINKQEVKLLIYKGVDEKGTAMKQVMSGVFEGKNGSVILLIVGREANWLQSEIDTFFKSIK